MDEHGAVTPDEIESEETVVFSEPSEDLVEHALRPLEYSERFTGYKMTPSMGNAPIDFYKLGDAVLFILGTPWDAPFFNQGSKAAINWVNLGDFVTWLRDVIGDTELADEVERLSAEERPYYQQVKDLEIVLAARMDQYRKIVHGEDEPQDVESSGSEND